MCAPSVRRPQAAEEARQDTKALELVVKDHQDSLMTLRAELKREKEARRRADRQLDAVGTEARHVRLLLIFCLCVRRSACL